MQLEDNPSPAKTPAIAVWLRLWSEILRVVEETRIALGHHLRDGALEARSLEPSRLARSGEIVMGRSRLRLDCSLEASPAVAGESRFAAAFGADAPLVRIVIHRLREGAPPIVECVIAVDPLTEFWCSSDPELAPARLDDAFALERVVWGLLVD